MYVTWIDSSESMLLLVASFHKQIIGRGLRPHFTNEIIGILLQEDRRVVHESSCQICRVLLPPAAHFERPFSQPEKHTKLWRSQKIRTPKAFEQRTVYEDGLNSAVLWGTMSLMYTYKRTYHHQWMHIVSWSHGDILDPQYLIFMHRRKAA